MSEIKRNWREDLKIFRERMGGVTQERKDWQKEQRDYSKAISGVLEKGARTVPEIAEASGLPSDKILWHLMAMKKYGKIAEAGRSGDYFRYELKGGQS
ncbi:MAG: winged helix-turn-helix domain-containing protein [Bryobacteraceae bacterium]|jgi:predicted transcriptional regulator|nr:winged helix-turn-helix domain-containing protein [Bryobacteraceae bacterium]